ncbi:hypothetical protein [Flavobacterium crassostreae]|uniref:Uncharacterized protein n=1 Tax=Flavobacterium crassostreae TaxID=1763534 RepID=A0A1B9E7L3_9FLAO|nr:hypothetical protein [Flavobacterium crassostreae]OCB77947.1 hypothetical protein LPBF_03095 [Flavobacterium crassostreae]
MAYSKITIDFTSPIIAGTFLNLTESNYGISLFEIFKNARISRGSVAIPEGVPEDYNHPEIYYKLLASSYRNAFNLDYNTSNLFTVEINGSGIAGRVTILANYENANFILSGTDSGAIISIVNQQFTPPFIHTITSFSEATEDKSKKIKITQATSELAVSISSPFNLLNNTSNPFSFEWQRGQVINLTVKNAAGLEATNLITLPDVLSADNFSIKINNSPNGATAIVNNAFTTGLTLAYSLNGTDFQHANVFSGLDVGNYTLYVLDQYGGAFSKSFSVDQNGVYVPFFYISKSNSIRFAKRVKWSDTFNYKTDENTLGSEVDVKVAYSGCQNFKSDTIITTQFKSNYATNTVNIIKSDKTKISVPVVKKTNNIGIKDKRDAIKFNLGGTNTGVYFLAGNRYDYATNAVIDSYALNGLLPEWAIIGNYINLENAWYLIDNIFYDDDKNADVLVISNTYSGIDVGVMVSSIYNDFNYEVYEFTIDLSNYLNQTLQIEIENTDNRFDSLKHISERLIIAKNFLKNLEINYWNHDNTDIFYATGIRHLMNVEVTKQAGVSQEESEVYKTDTNAVLLSAQSYEADKFTFEPLSKEIWRKLMIALSHKMVYINGTQYVKSGDFETEGPLNDSNLYVLSAIMVKAGAVYSTSSEMDEMLNDQVIEIPGLIQTEIGFLKY